MKVILLAQGIWSHNALSSIKNNKFLELSALVGDSYSYTLVPTRNFYNLPQTGIESDELLKQIISIHKPEIVLSIQYPYKISSEIIALFSVINDYSRPIRQATTTLISPLIFHS